MNKIQELEKQIEEERLKDKLKHRIEELEQLKDEYEGKCFGSKIFERNNYSGYENAIYYEKFFLKDNEIYVRFWNIRLSKLNNYYNKSKTDISYSRNISEQQLTGQNDYNAFYNLDNAYYAQKTQITLDKFMKCWNSLDEINLIVKENFNKNFNLEEQDLLRGTTSGLETCIEKSLKYLNIEFIDITKDKKVFDCLKYSRLPFFQENKYLPKIYAKEIINYQIKLNEDSISNVWTIDRVKSSLIRENEILNNYINSL